MEGKRKLLWTRTEWFCVLVCMLISLILLLNTSYTFGMGTEAMVEAEETNLVSESDGSCTIFLYICGSNLESKYGLASLNIDELLEADIPESTNVIIETGGTSRWWSSEWIAEDKLQRYTIQDHHLELLMEMDNASMGSEDTFCDFLRWGGENYFADRNILVMWDHGGSSADGICYDENFDFDCLNRMEIAEAFDDAKLPGKFDLICLDTCYMGSLANTTLFSNYARYMTASQTIVPGPGMDYITLAEGAAASDLVEFGKVLCDTFMVKCDDTGRAESAQLAFYDLDAAENLVNELDRGAAAMRLVYEKTGDSFGFLRGAQIASVAGPGSKSNVIDLMTFVNTMTLLERSPRRDRIQALLDKLVLYQVCGSYAELNGVSIFFPINYDESQLEAYESITPSDNYNQLLREIYSDLPEVMITFKDPGSIGENGTYDIELDEESRPYLRSITLRFWKENERLPGAFTLLADSEVDTYLTGLGRRLSELRESTVLNGEAYALDSHLLLVRVSSLPLTQLYSAPVQVNGQDTNYAFVVARTLLMHRQKILYTMLGSLIDENGLPSREIVHLKSGDKIAVYSAADETGEDLVLQDEFTIEDEDILPEKIPLPEGKYRCQYIVTDIIGRTVGSDYCLFEITGEDETRQVTAEEIVPNTGESSVTLSN